MRATLNECNPTSAYIKSLINFVSVALVNKNTTASFFGARRDKSHDRNQAVVDSHRNLKNAHTRES